MDLHQDKALHREETIEHLIHKHCTTGCLGGHGHARHNKLVLPLPGIRRPDG
jgi:hypothetical protein